MKKPEDKHVNPRFKATYRGEVIGWYDTLEQANAIIKKVRAKEKQEAEDFRNWLWKR